MFCCNGKVVGDGEDQLERLMTFTHSELTLTLLTQNPVDLIRLYGCNLHIHTSNAIIIYTYMYVHKKYLKNDYTSAISIIIITIAIILNYYIYIYFKTDPI